MKYGWWTKYRINRPLTQKERDAALPRERQLGVIPSQRMGLIRINSTYIDWIDPAFSDRGTFDSFFMLLGILFCGLVSIADVIFSIVSGHAIFLIVQIAAIPGALIFYFFALRFEFCTYTYFPIRFNRKTRKIYVFRHNGPNGVLVVPWKDVFFHIGDNGGQVYEKYRHNIRGEILDGDTVRDTFSVGLDAERMQEIYDRWEFIRRYMDEGPEAVAEDPLDKYVELSVSSRWDNCCIMAGGSLAAGTLLLQRVLSPFIFVFAATRWIIMKTCKDPVFNDEVEADSIVEPDDPNVWPIPAYAYQFSTTVPGVLKRANERRRNTRDPHARPSLADRFN